MAGTVLYVVLELAAMQTRYWTSGLRRSLEARKVGLAAWVSPEPTHQATALCLLGSLGFVQGADEAQLSWQPVTLLSYRQLEVVCSEV